MARSEMSSAGASTEAGKKPFGYPRPGVDSGRISDYWWLVV